LLQLKGDAMHNRGILERCALCTVCLCPCAWGLGFNPGPAKSHKALQTTCQRLLPRRYQPQRWANWAPQTRYTLWRNTRGSL